MRHSSCFIAQLLRKIDKILGKISWNFCKRHRRIFCLFDVWHGSRLRANIDSRFGIFLLVILDATWFFFVLLSFLVRKSLGGKLNVIFPWKASYRKMLCFKKLSKTSDSLILFVFQESLKSKLLGWNAMTSFQYLFIFSDRSYQKLFREIKTENFNSFQSFMGENCKLTFLLSFTVRQENERLIQESMIRARMAANFTDAPPVIPPTTSSPSHPTLKVLQGNFVP